MLSPSASKLARCQTIVNDIAVRRSCANGADAGTGVIRIDGPRGAKITIRPNTRLGWGRVYEETVGRRHFPEQGCDLVEIEMFGAKCLAVNVRGNALDLFTFKPGAWEPAFGSDPAGDRDMFDRSMVPSPKSPDWQAYLASPDAKAPPLRVGPAHDFRPPQRRPRMGGYGYESAVNTAG